MLLHTCVHQRLPGEWDICRYGQFIGIHLLLFLSLLVPEVSLIYLAEMLHSLINRARLVLVLLRDLLVRNVLNLDMAQALMPKIKVYPLAKLNCPEVCLLMRDSSSIPLYPYNHMIAFLYAHSSLFLVNLILTVSGEHLLVVTRALIHSC